MENNIYNKLLNMRIALQKETVKDFDELMALITVKAKYYKVLPLYSLYDTEATLTLVDIEDIQSVIKFTASTDKISVNYIKQYLYKMAFEVDGAKEYISPKQYIELTERIKQLNISEKEILDRYQLISLTDMTTDIYKRCTAVFDKMKKEGSK